MTVGRSNAFVNLRSIKVMHLRRPKVLNVWRAADIVDALTVDTFGSLQFIDLGGADIANVPSSTEEIPHFIVIDHERVCRVVAYGVGVIGSLGQACQEDESKAKKDCHLETFG